MPKILRQLLVLATFTISMMIYMRASMDELTDERSEVDQLTITYLALLAFFAGIYESMEVYDHLFPQQSRDIHDNGPTTSNTLTSSLFVKKSTLVMTAALTPPLILCAWAHKLQGNQLAHSLGIEENFWGLVFATPALIKFSTVAIPHLLHTLNGTRERYSLSVTNNDITHLPEESIPPLKWWIMLSVLVYLHLPEGYLIAAPIRDDLLKYLAALGFALAESVPHLNQLEQLPQNIACILKEGSQSSLSSLVLRIGAGTVGGLASASEALLAALVGSRSKAIAWIAPLVEFVLGFAETQQHLVPSVQKLLQYSIFKPSEKKTVDKTHAHSNDEPIHDASPTLC